MAGWSWAIVAEKGRAWPIFRTKRRNNRGGDFFREGCRVPSVTFRLGHHQPEADENRDQRQAKPRPLLHVRPRPTLAPILRASMTATSGRSAAERLPIPMAATIAGVTDMPNDGAGEQGAVPGHAHPPFRTCLKRTTPR